LHLTGGKSIAAKLIQTNLLVALWRPEKSVHLTDGNPFADNTNLLVAF
jgi:hypothetical protein